MNSPTVTCFVNFTSLQNQEGAACLQVVLHCSVLPQEENCQTPTEIKIPTQTSVEASCCVFQYRKGSFMYLVKSWIQLNTGNPGFKKRLQVPWKLLLFKRKPTHMMRTTVKGKVHRSAYLRVKLPEKSSKICKAGRDIP